MASSLLKRALTPTHVRLQFSSISSTRELPEASVKYDVRNLHCNIKEVEIKILDHHSDKTILCSRLTLFHHLQLDYH